MLLIDLPPVSVAVSTPPGSIYANGYSDPPHWRVELNPLFPAQSNKYRITRVSDGAVFTTDTRYNQPLDDNAGADACRRAGSGQIIELGAGCDLNAIWIGNTDTGKKFCAYWGSPQGPFTPFRGLTIRSADPANPARIRGFQNSNFVRNNQGVTFWHGPVGLTLQHIDLHYPGSGFYIFSHALGEVFDRYTFDGCRFTGDKTYGSGFDCKTAVRVPYGQTDFQDVVFEVETDEHCTYTDAPQGLRRMLRCENSSSTGPAGARCGRTFSQSVSRSRLDNLPGGNPIYGGPPGFGTILFEDCIARRTGVSESSGAFTVAGFLGDVIIRRCSAPNTSGAMIAIWSDADQGLHTTLGQFDLPPWPVAGSAFTTRRVLIDEFDGFVASPWPNPAAPIAISGAELVEIGRFNVVASRPVFGLWPWSGATQLGGPLDNGEVRFLVPPLSTPVSAWAGFNGGARANYGSANNANQGAPFGTGSSGQLSAAGIDALARPNLDPFGVSADLQVNTLNPTDTHDEPDICWHPETGLVMVCFNDRTPTPSPGSDMDQRFRVYSDAGVSQFTPERYATNQVSYSQWRPLLSALSGGRWLVNCTNGPNDNGIFNVVSASAPFSFALVADVAITDTSGRRGENDGCELASGDLLTVWNQVEGVNTTIRRRKFSGTTYAPLGASSVLGASIGKNKLDPRVKADASRVWVCYHAQEGTTSHSNEYDGSSVWATVLDATATSVVRAEFNVGAAAGLAGIGRRPEVVLFGGGRALIVWEHFPSGYVDYTVPLNPQPIYAGQGHIYVQAFDADGNALTQALQVDTPLSSTANPAPLRPDIDVSADGTQALICWTAANAAGPNGSIYSPQNGWRLWARMLDLTQLDVAPFPQLEWRVEANQVATNFARSWTRVTATNWGGQGGWALTYRFGQNVEARFFQANGVALRSYPPWPQPLAGTVNLPPVVVSLDVPAGDVFVGNGSAVDLPSLVLVVDAPAGDVLKPLFIDLPPALAQVRVPDGGVDAPRTIGLPSVRMGTRLKAPAVEFGVGIDLPSIVVAVSAPAGTASVAYDLPPVVLAVDVPAGSVDTPRVIDLPAVAVAVSVPDGGVAIGAVFDLPPLLLAVDAPAGTVDVPRNLDLPPLVLAVTAPAGTLTQDLGLDLPSLVLAVTVPAGTVDSGLMLGLPSLFVLVDSPAGHADVVYPLPPVVVSVTAPAGELYAFTIQGELEIAVAVERALLVRAREVELPLEAAVSVERNLEVDP